MGRLKSLPPRIATLAPRIGFAPGDEKARDKHRSATQHWRAWYGTPAWKQLRRETLIRDDFTCQMCGKADGSGRTLVCDHKVPHRGDRERFFDGENLQILCAPCHDSQKQKQERSMR
jgi:5-methylcytosine-specific restriction protein A